MHCCWSLWGQQLLKQTRQCHKPAVRLLSVQQLSSVRDALWQDLCCSSLSLVIVPLCEQHTFTSTLAVTQACCLLSALFCTSALISEGYTLPGFCCSALLLVIVRAATSQTDMAVPQACCQAVVCTAALISEGCTLAGSVLQCTVAGHCGGSTFSNRHGSATSLLSGCCLYSSSHQ